MGTELRLTNTQSICKAPIKLSVDEAKKEIRLNKSDLQETADGLLGPLIV